MKNENKTIKIKYYFDLLSLKDDPDKYFDKPGFKETFKKFFNVKNFRMKDVEITYRKAYNLTDKLLKQDRGAGKWRTFSFKELVFIDIVTDLMEKYNLSYKNLQPLANTFFNEKFKDCSEAAFLDAFIGFKVYIIIAGSENVDFYNEIYFDRSFNYKYNSYILVDLSAIIMNLWEEFGKEKRMQISYRGNMSVSEKQLLDIIRSDDFSIINIKKSKGSFVVRASSTKEISKKELYNIISKKDFVDIQVLKRDGSIVKIKVEDIYKI